MLLLREFFLLYFFLFYSYFYFSVDEEFMIFIVIFIWVIFFFIFYLKSLQNFFEDNLKFLINEYFFFHNKRNLFLVIIRDQYFDFILLNNFINFIIKNIFFKINVNIKKKIKKYNKKDILIISERLNVLKMNLKLLLSFYYLHIFIKMSKIIFFLLKNENKFFNFFFSKFFFLRKKVELNYLSKKQVELLNKNKEKFIFNVYYKFLRNLKKSKLKLIPNFFLNELLFFKLNKINLKKTKNKKYLFNKKKKIIKLIRILKYGNRLQKGVLFKKLRVTKNWATWERY